MPSASSLFAATLLAASGGAAAQADWTLVMLDTSNGGVCLDGTPGAFCAWRACATSTAWPASNCWGLRERVASDRAAPPAHRRPLPPCADFRPGTGSGADKWIVHLQGGGCVRRYRARAAVGRELL